MFKIVPGAPLEVLKTGRNLPLYTVKEECRNIVTSGLPSHQCEATDSSSPPAAGNEMVEDKRPPRGLTKATPLAPVCAPSYPGDSRRGDLEEQTPRTARAVLTTPFNVVAHFCKCSLPVWRMSRLSSQSGPIWSPLPLAEMFREPQT